MRLVSIDPVRRNRYAPLAMKIPTLRLGLGRVLGLLLFALGGFLSAPTAASPPSAPSQSGELLVLLKNGRTMQGRVHDGGEHYHLLRRGSDLRLRKDSVLHVTDSLPSAYAWLKARVQKPNAEDHLRLANWCIQQELWQAAAEEMLLARQKSPKDHRHAAVERRLQIAWQQALKAEAGPTQTAGQAKSNRVVDAAVVPAAYQQPAQSTAPQMDRQAADTLATLPDGALRQFTRRVQPILVNNCTAGGCHQSGAASSFQLNRQLLHGMSNKESTRENLLAVLSAIDKENPQSSPLLEAGREPHAKWSLGRFTGRRARLDETLSDWVDLVTNRQAVPTTDAASEDDPTTDRPTSKAPESKAPEAESDASAAADAILSALAVSPQPKKPQVQQASHSEPTDRRLQPVDEFDPAIFNHRFRKTPSEKSTP